MQHLLRRTQNPSGIRIAEIVNRNTNTLASSALDSLHVGIGHVVMFARDFLHMLPGFLTHRNNFV